MIPVVLMAMVVVISMRMAVRMRMVMFMIMGVPWRGSLVGIVARHPEAPAGDSSAQGPFKAAFRKGDGKRGEGLSEDLSGDPEVVKCGHGHVAANAGKGINVKCFHGICGYVILRKQSPIRAHSLGKEKPSHGPLKKITATYRHGSPSLLIQSP
jgi:hypothetical protein